MKQKIALLFLMLIILNGCSKNSLDKNDTLATSNDRPDSTLTTVIQTVLNSQEIIKLSKAELAQEMYGKIYIYFDAGVPIPESPIYQNGHALELTKSKLNNEIPCYRFKELIIRENKAHVSFLHLVFLVYELQSEVVSKLVSSELAPYMILYISRLGVGSFPSSSA